MSNINFTEITLLGSGGWGPTTRGRPFNVSIYELSVCVLLSDLYRRSLELVAYTHLLSIGSHWPNIMTGVDVARYCDVTTIFRLSRNRSLVLAVPKWNEPQNYIRSAVLSGQTIDNGNSTGVFRCRYGSDEIVASGVASCRQQQLEQGQLHASR